MPLRSARAQVAVESINIALAHHEWVEAGVTAQSGTWHLLDDLSRRSLTTIASFTAFAEMFVVETMLEALTERIRSFGPGPEKSFYSTLSKQVENSFQERVNLLQGWFGVDLRTWPRWEAWTGFVEARHAWAHGQGQLTRHQRARGASAAIEKAGMTVVGNVVKCEIGTAKEGASCAISLVDLIDDALT